MKNEFPQLILYDLDTVEPLTYRCSTCGQMFLLPEDRTPKEAVAEMWIAFKDHVRESHPEFEAAESEP